MIEHWNRAVRKHVFHSSAPAARVFPLGSSSSPAWSASWSSPSRISTRPKSADREVRAEEERMVTVAEKSIRGEEERRFCRNAEG